MSKKPGQHHVYHFNRVFRNSVDAGITKRELAKVGTRIVSTVIDMGDTPEASLIETVLHAVDQYQSEASGADIRFKMAQKVKNGGSVSRAPLGYLNVRKPKPGGGEIRTVELDPDRAPLVRLAFELYATGEYTLNQLVDELTDRGLTTRVSGRTPSGPISDSKLSHMFGDTFYLGYVRYRDPHTGEQELVRGRHEPLVDEATWERVQAVRDARRTAGERQRVHQHYLKGSLWCDRCRQRGRERRLRYSRARGNGGAYYYFYCSGREDASCDLPYLPADEVEALVQARVAAERLSDESLAALEAVVEAGLHDTHSATVLRQEQLQAQLRKLDVQEENLIDLAADGDLPREKIRARLHEIRRKKERLERELVPAVADLSLDPPSWFWAATWRRVS